MNKIYKKLPLFLVAVFVVFAPCFKLAYALRGERPVLHPEENGLPEKIQKKTQKNSPLTEELSPYYGDYINVLTHPDERYYRRLKKILKEQFDPISALKEAFDGGKLNKVMKVETVVGITVDSFGNFGGVVLLRSSGLKNYDDSIVEMIKKISFEKPPLKMLDKENLIRMAWTFTVYL